MQVNDYIKNYQNIIYNTFKNAINNNSLVHAYLLVGNSGIPLLDIAKYLAKTLVCDSPNPLADNSCITCQRFDNGNYADLFIYDGSKESIKKEDVLALEANFEKKALEKKNKKLYILHLVENMSIQAINSMLKFLEEPQENIFIFLTTNNESLVLPTIISRCQVLHLKPIPRDDVIKLSLEEGIDAFDAQLMSYVFNEPELLKQHVNNDSDYQVAKECLNLLIEALIENKNKVIYIGNKNISDFIVSKQSATYFFDILCTLFLDIQAIYYHRDPYLKSINDKLILIQEKITNIDDLCLQLLKTRQSISLNVNVSLILDHIINIIIKNMKEE